MVRVLQVLDTLDVCAGMTTVVVNYHRKIDRNRLQFDYLFFQDSTTSYRDEIENLGGRIYKVPRPGVSKGFFRKIDEFFSEHAQDYAAIHCHMLWSPIVFGPIAKKHGIKNVIAHCHSTQFSENPISALRNRVMVFLDRFCVTRYMACSEEAKKLFSFVPEQDITLLRNAIETEHFCFDPQKRRECRASLGIAGNAVVIGHVGRFSPEKNHDFLLQIFKAFQLRRKDAKLLLVGAGPLEEEIRRQIIELGLDLSVIQLGTRRDMDRLYAAMDLLMLPSLFEGIPMVLLEAQASGLPCMASTAVSQASDVTGLVEFFPLDAGAETWAEKMYERLARSQADKRDNRHLEKLWASGYDLTSAAAVLTDYYETLSKNK